jgi:folylpolyglutamate synthase
MYLADLTAKSVHETDLAALKTQQELANAWMARLPGYDLDRVHVLPSIQHAVRIVRTLDGPIDVLVTGSLHLVGGVIEVAGLSEVAL